MSAKYDIESFVNDMVAILQSKLPAKITAINAEKNDSIVLANIDNYYDDATEQVFNVNQFLHYNITNISAKSIGFQTATTVTMFFEIAFIIGNSGNTLQKALRYTRAVREVFQENCKRGKYGTLEIADLIPGKAVLNNGSDFKVAGVLVESTITG